MITIFLNHITRNYGFFLLEELIKKSPILHIWQLDHTFILDKSFWTCPFCGLSIWLVIFFTNMKVEILTSQFVHMAIWLVVKSAVIFIHHMSSPYAIIIATCQVECTCIIDMCHQFRVCIVMRPNLKWYLHAMRCHLNQHMSILHSTTISMLVIVLFISTKKINDRFYQTLFKLVCLFLLVSVNVDMITLTKTSHNKCVSID